MLEIVGVDGCGGVDSLRFISHLAVLPSVSDTVPRARGRLGRLWDRIRGKRGGRRAYDEADFSDEGSAAWALNQEGGTARRV